jgi:hypothetical protein
MANYNLAQGGDIHYNEAMGLWPQNAFIKGNPEFGSSTTILKPADHWAGGHYAPVRHMNFNDHNHECALKEVAQKLVAGDSFLTHIIPSMSLLTDFHFVIHSPKVGASFTVKLAAAGTVLGTIDASVAGDGWFQVAAGGHYVPSDTNDAIEIVLDTWPVDPVVAVASDPCGVFGPCETPINFCWSSAAFYKNARMEKWCEATCYESCGS